MKSKNPVQNYQFTQVFVNCIHHLLNGLKFLIKNVNRTTLPGERIDGKKHSINDVRLQELPENL